MSSCGLRPWRTLRATNEALSNRCAVSQCRKDSNVKGFFVRSPADHYEKMTRWENLSHFNEARTRPFNLANDSARLDVPRASLASIHPSHNGSPPPETAAPQYKAIY
jgi:hypothetical protein